jgi:lipoprotein-anchoring transpeptidase ErfK/SrfK
LRNGIGFVSKFQRWKDWTAGCVALTNTEVEELYNGVKIGAVIEILP